MSADILSLKMLGRCATVLPSSSLLAFVAAVGLALPVADALRSPAAANPQIAVLPTTSVDDLMRMRDAWGKAPAASSAAAPAMTVASGDLAVLPTTSVADLIKMRETWGAAPSSVAAGSTSDNGLAVLPTTSVADLITMREGWGEGKPGTMDMPPLAAGTFSPLPQDKMELPAGPASDPVVHALVPAPAPQLSAVPQDVLDKAMTALLAERAGWGTAPAAGASPAVAASAATAADGRAVLPTTNVADLIRMRDAWGKAPAATPVKATAAAAPAAPAPQAAAASPLPILPTTSVDDLFGMRDSWGKAPAGVRTAAAAATAPAAAPAAVAADAADAAGCEAKLRQIAMSGLIQFESSSAALNVKSNATLDAIAAVAKTCKKGKIRIGGHTDASGRATSNKALSARRAEAVANYLLKAGVPKDRVEAVGFGQERPVASNDTPEGRAQNRRIEFTVVE